MPLFFFVITSPAGLHKCLAYRLGNFLIPTPHLERSAQFSFNSTHQNRLDNRKATMGQVLETSLAEPVEYLIVFTVTAFQALVIWLSARIYLRYAPARWRCLEQETSSWLLRGICTIWNLILWLLGNTWTFPCLTLGSLYACLPSVEWWEGFAEAVKREGQALYWIFRLWYERRFSKKHRELMLRAERRKQRLEEEEAVRREEEEKLRALEEFSRDMSGIRLPGGWD